MDLVSLWETICAEAAKLWAMIFDTEVSPQQREVRAVLERIGTVLGNLFFTLLALVDLGFGLRVLLDQHPSVLAMLHVLWQKFSLGLLAALAMGTIVLLLLALRGLLVLYKFIHATDLTKLYFLVEVVHLVFDAWQHPGSSPTPYLFAALKKLLGL